MKLNDKQFIEVSGLNPDYFIVPRPGRASRSGGSCGFTAYRPVVGNNPASFHALFSPQGTADGRGLTLRGTGPRAISPRSAACLIPRAEVRGRAGAERPTLYFQRPELPSR